MTETRENRLKRLRMRAWRRGTKEMDITLGPWADAHLEGLDDARLDAFEDLLAEYDQDLMQWFMGQAPTPERHIAMVALIGAWSQDRLAEGY